MEDLMIGKGYQRIRWRSSSAIGTIFSDACCATLSLHKINASPVQKTAWCSSTQTKSVWFYKTHSCTDSFTGSWLALGAHNNVTQTTLSHPKAVLVLWKQIPCWYHDVLAKEHMENPNNWERLLSFRHMHRQCCRIRYMCTVVHVLRNVYMSYVIQ